MLMIWWSSFWSIPWHNDNTLEKLGFIYGNVFEIVENDYRVLLLDQYSITVNRELVNPKVNPFSIPPGRYIRINFEGAKAHYICSSPQDLILKLLIYIWHEFNVLNLHVKFDISDFEVNTWKGREGPRSWKEQEKV